MLSDCTLCLLKRQTFVVRKLFFFVVIFWPTGGDCHAELSLVGGGGRWEVGGGRVSYGRSVTHLGSLASLSLSPSFARESSRPQLSLGSSQALGLYEHKLTNTTSGCWFFFEISPGLPCNIFKLSHLRGSVWAKFCLSAQACLLLNLFCPLSVERVSKRSSLLDAQEGLGADYHTKDSPPLLQTIPPRRSIIKQSDFNFSFCRGEKP